MEIGIEIMPANRANRIMSDDTDLGIPLFSKMETRGLMAIEIRVAIKSKNRTEVMLATNLIAAMIKIAQKKVLGEILIEICFLIFGIT